ncbi:MAG: hypothetical protein AAFV95_16605 [Bacteroidota bacterium]
MKAIFLLCSLWIMGTANPVEPAQTASLSVKAQHIQCQGMANGTFEVEIAYSTKFVFPGELIISDGDKEYENGRLPAGAYCLTLQDGNGKVAAEVCQSIEVLNAADCSDSGD